MNKILLRLTLLSFVFSYAALAEENKPNPSMKATAPTPMAINVASRDGKQIETDGHEHDVATGDHAAEAGAHKESGNEHDNDHDNDHGHDDMRKDEHDPKAEDTSHTSDADEHGHESESGGHKEGADAHEESGEDGHGHGEAASDAELSKEQRLMAGIETMVVTRQSLGEPILAPGEVTLNKYRTSKVTPRISAQVSKRYARLGNIVKKLEPLVTLSSVQMAEAQGELLQTKTEWRRVKKLGRKVVSEKRYVNAEITYQQAYAKVQAYGMIESQIKKILASGDASKATGEFTLLAPQDGTIINDQFILGEFIEPGRILFEISDESTLWVEARVTPEDASNIVIGTRAQVKVNKKWSIGKVTQARHTLDEVTRTLAIHIEIANPEDRLHPGQFVSVVIEGKSKKEGIAVPLTAVLRAPDGDWQVFVEVAPGRFEPKEVEVLSTAGNIVLISGIAAGSTIVKTGAFFVQSEIAKSGFEVHNH